MNYVSIRSIFPTLALDRSQIDEDQLLEWATDCYESLNVKAEYEHNAVILNVENHKAPLPFGIKEITSVAYLHNSSPSQDDWDSICEILESDDQQNCGCTTRTTSQATNTDTTSQTATAASIQKPTYYAPNQYNLQRVKVQGIINNYTLFVRSSFYNNNFSFMRRRDIPFATQTECSDCPNSSCADCDFTYNISSNGEIVTEFQEGVICIAYRHIPLDDEGLVKIPDDPDVRKAIGAYVSAKHWETRWNMKEEGAGQRYQYFLQQAEKLMMKVKGKLGIRNLNFQSIRFINDRYKQLINQPVVWNFNSGVYLE